MRILHDHLPDWRRKGKREVRLLVEDEELLTSETVILVQQHSQTLRSVKKLVCMFDK